LRYSASCYSRLLEPDLRQYKGQKLFHRFIHALYARLDHDIGVAGDIERGVDAGEEPDLPAAGFRIEAFDITLFTYGEGGIHEDLNKIVFPDDPFCHFPDVIRGTDKAVDGDDAGVDEELRNFCDPADILKTVSFGKGEVIVDARADDVTVKDLREIAQLMKPLLKLLGDGCLPRPGKPGHPDYPRTLVKEFFFVRTLQRFTMLREMGGLWFGHGNSVLEGKSS